MSEIGLTKSDPFLTDAAKKYFSGIYEVHAMKTHEPVVVGFSWEPSLHFKANDHLTIIAEASETPYPAIFRLRHADVLNVHMPIAVYCICPEEAFLQEARQDEVDDLQAHGYGLITVDKKGKAKRRFACIPLIQHLPESEFITEIKGLPLKVRVHLRTTYDSYNHNAGNGVKELTEIVEGLVRHAGKKAAKKGWISNAAACGTIANLLDKMAAAPSCKNAIPAIGGARSYISEYRNTSHHFPKNKVHAYRKYQDCLHAFRDGIKRIQAFRTAMKHLCINVTI